MNLFIGIDPSINSTGICIQFYNDDLTKRVKDDKFYIIRGNKLTKREKKVEQDNAQLFEYVLYDKIETKESENNHEFEKIKTENFIKIVDCVYNIVYNNCLREIDWNRGKPYIYTIEDYNMLMKSRNLYARKFDSNIDINIIDKIYDTIKEDI